MKREVAYIDTAVNNGAHVNITWGELVHFAEISGFNVVRSDNTYRFSRIITKRGVYDV